MSEEKKSAIARTIGRRGVSYKGNLSCKPPNPEP